MSLAGFLLDSIYEMAYFSPEDTGIEGVSLQFFPGQTPHAMRVKIYAVDRSKKTDPNASVSIPSLRIFNKGLSLRVLNKSRQQVLAYLRPRLQIIAWYSVKTDNISTRQFDAFMQTPSSFVDPHSNVPPTLVEKQINAE